MLNPAPASPEALVTDVDILVPNETESQIITGMADCSKEDMMDAMTRMSADLIVVMTLGAEGAFIGRGEEVGVGGRVKCRGDRSHVRRCT